MRKDDIAVLEETLEILERGYYETESGRAALKLTRAQMESAQVFLPEDVAAVGRKRDFPHVHVLGRCVYGCENMDAFGLAREMRSGLTEQERNEEKPILVLNLANPVHPGGGVRHGARAQEEDLCRCSSLLLSLESENARPYYEYNRSLHTYMGSDAVIIHPQVEIIRDEKRALLRDSVIVSVMTCAAPMVLHGMEGLTQAQYEELLLRRITGMLKIAAYLGCRRLVLGAFGCGAFGNDARVVSDLFYRALKEFNFDGMREKDVFRRVGFAVLDRSADQYNYREFARNFEHFYRDEDRTETARVQKELRKTETRLDAVRGCLYGGAVGDALGYPVEFLSEERIFSRFGPDGVMSYVKDPASGRALISDDTQMTLFTAVGLLVGGTRGAMRGIRGKPRAYVARAYHDWLLTQTSAMTEVNRHGRFTEAGGSTWLLDVPELYARRAPGNTCLSALMDGTEYEDYIKAARNDSKGCGGVMRVAPIALQRAGSDLRAMDLEAAQLAAITHGHSLGYMPAAVLAHIISRIVFPPESGRMPLEEIVREARDAAADLFAGDPNLPALVRVIDLALELSADDSLRDIECIRRLGQGWVAEETLAIALFCALRHRDDFSAGVAAAVSHGGDSDSTGAVTGNILGALLGFDAIDDRWKEDLELSDLILEIADDLCHGCRMSEYGAYRDPDWEDKYIHMKRPASGSARG